MARPPFRLDAARDPARRPQNIRLPWFSSVPSVANKSLLYPQRAQPPRPSHPPKTQPSLLSLMKILCAPSCPSCLCGKKSSVSSVPSVVKKPYHTHNAPSPHDLPTHPHVRIPQPATICSPLRRTSLLAWTQHPSSAGQPSHETKKRPRRQNQRPSSAPSARSMFNRFPQPHRNGASAAATQIFFVLFVSLW